MANVIPDVGVISLFKLIISGAEVTNDVVQEFELFQNYPNPFNPNTIITNSVSIKSYVNITVYNVIGKEVVTLVDEEKPAGTYEVEFSAAGRSAAGKDIYNLPSGVYIYRLTAGSFTNSKKMMLLK